MGLAAAIGGSALAGAGIASGVIGAGASIANGVMSSNAANNAANAQLAANQAAIAEQQREFNIGQANLSPWLSSGRAALNQQDILLGLGAMPDGVLSGANVTAAGSPTITPGGLTQAQATQLLQDRPDVMAAYTLAKNGGVGPNGQQVPAADMNSPAAAMLTSPEAYANYWYNNMGGSGSYQLPGSGAGTPGTAANGQTAAQQQQAAIDALKSNPLYTSQYNNGVNTILSNASATGGLRGGNVNSSLATFGSNLLGSVYQQQLANLGGLSGQGMNGAGSVNNLLANTGNNISGLLSSNGGISAGGILGSSGAMSGGINNGLSQLLGGLSQSGILGGGGSGAYAAYGGAGNALADSQNVFNAGGGTFGSGGYNFNV